MTLHDKRNRWFREGLYVNVYPEDDVRESVKKLNDWCINAELEMIGGHSKFMLKSFRKAVGKIFGKELTK